MDHPRYSQFDTREVTYKVFNDQPIKAYVMVPKSLPSGTYPILVTFHGGFHVSPVYIKGNYALLNSAIIVTPDYRLIPESNGLDILDDIAGIVKAHLSKIIVHGASAGGHLATISEFTQPFIKAIFAVYPGMGINRKGESQILGAPTIPKHFLDDHLKAMEPGKILTAADPPERMVIGLSLLQQKRKAEFFGTDERLFAMKVLEKLDTVPFTLLLRGEDDSAVPVDYSIKVAEAIKERGQRERIASYEPVPCLVRMEI
ncbi:Alpha/Beta hydrolase protein [Lipomyces doorenjongii]|uniref:Alpha/Beta hydrolase protein n=1 Tax=Lipomyces doorenjongii TaxID=383834 RepID=UPI0034CD31B2